MAVNKLPRTLACGLVILSDDINDLQEVAIDTLPPEAVPLALGTPKEAALKPEF